MKTFITGPMFSGKTTVLLMFYNNYKGKKMLFKPSVDNREGTCKVVSRDGLVADCQFIENEFPNVDKGVHIFIDEAQFLSEEVLKEILKYENVTFCGLNTDWQGNKWPYLNVVDEIRPLKTITCSAVCDCGKPAYFSKRLSKSVYLVDVGHEYKPVCEDCFKNK